MEHDILNSALAVFQWQNMIFMVLGVLFGVTIGALPGMSVTLGVALMLPFTFGLPPAAGILLLIGVYCAGTYGGSITAILLKTPGTAASAATAEDGFAMAQKGKAAEALNIALYASVIGGLISGFILLFTAPQVANFALKFSAPEYFMLAIFGLTTIAGVSGKSISKGIVMACIGVLVATIGIDPIAGTTRFYFGMNDLLRGVNIVPVLIGLFAISEILKQVENKSSQISINNNFERKPFKLSKLKPHMRTIVKSSLIGTIVGAIPGTGGGISAFISYNEARRSSKDPDSFGKGNPDGVAASESGNNGTTGTTLIPMLTLGIPGDVVTAVLLGALLIQGLAPGPQLFTNHGDLVYTVMIGFIVVNVIMFFVGKFAIKYAEKVTLIPSVILFPLVLGLCLVGAYSFNNSVFAVFIALIFGVVGYILPKYGYPLTPLLIAMILGPLAETSLRQSLIFSEGSMMIFFERPISLAFAVLTLIMIGYTTYDKMKNSKKEIGGN